MPKVIMIVDPVWGGSHFELDVWSDLTPAEVEGIPGVTGARVLEEGRRMYVGYDPRWGKDTVSLSLTRAANVKAQLDE